MSRVTPGAPGNFSTGGGGSGGDASAANQLLGNVSLASIDAKITAVNTGAVVISSSALPALAATSTLQTSGGQKTQIVDGSGNVIGATSNALDINIKSGNLTTLPVTNTGTFAVQATLQTQTDTVMVGGVNIKEINAVTPLMGAGNGGTGSLRVNIASDQVSIPVAATLSAETTKVIGTVNQGTSPWVVSGAVTNTVLSVVGGGTEATAQRVTLASDSTGVLTVKQATAANLNMTEASASSILTSVQLIDDIVYTDDTSTHSTGSSKGALMMAAATPTDTAVNANDIGALAMTVNRELLVQVNTALPAGTNGIGKLTANSGVDIGDVDVTTVGTITPGTAATSLGKAEDAVHSSGDVGVFGLAVANEAQSSLAADGDYIGHATDTKGNTLAVGNIAHDGADAGAPVKIGGKATNVEPAAVSATADRANLITDMVGKLIVLPYANPENFVSGAITSAMTGTTSTSLVAAPASGLRNYITTIIVSNAHATVGTDVIIQDGSGGTTLLTIPAAAVYGGAAITLPVPLRQPTTATAIFCANVTTGASTKVSAVGYKGV